MTPTDNLFWCCSYAACFWSQVQKWFKKNHVIHLKSSKSQSIKNIIMRVGKVFIFTSQSVDTMQLEKFKMYVKHHSTFEKYMAHGNQTRVVYGDRWNGLRVTEGWD